MVTLDQIPTPALVLDLEILARNIAKMATKAAERRVRLRPHVKTHKCVEIARMQEEAGAEGLTVATFAEARVFADAGFEDIVVAMPLAPSRVPEALELAERVKLGLVGDSLATAEVLERTGAHLHVWAEIDCGQHRSGADPAGEQIVQIARFLHDSRTLRFEGLLTHAGHSYACRGGHELAAVAEDERREIVRCADRLRDAGLSVEERSVGSTPTMSAVRDLTGVTEVRPGNYVFHDYTQTIIGSCRVADCAVTVLSTVISASAPEERGVVDAGALALSKDASPAGVPETMGRVFADYTKSRLDEARDVAKLSQEHGWLRGRFEVGERVRILPNHSCLTAACFDRYHVVRDERVVDTWPIRRER